MRAGNQRIAHGIGHAVELTAVHAPIGRTEHAQLASNGLRRQPLIAGEHQRAQPRVAEARDCVFHASRWRIGESQEPEKRQSVEPPLRRFAHFAGCDRQHAQAAGRQAVVDGQERSPARLVECVFAIRVQDALARLDDAAGRTLHERGKSPLYLMEGCHVLALARKRHDADGPGLGERRASETEPVDCRQHGAVDWIDQRASRR